MRARAWPRTEPLALIAATLATAMAVSYAWLMGQQGDQPLPWVLALLLAGALLAAYGAIRPVRCRRAALVAASAALTTLGLFALLSIGLPIMPPAPWPWPRSCAHLNGERRKGRHRRSPGSGFRYLPLAITNRT